MSFAEVTDKKTGRLLFRYDAERDIIHYVDHRRRVDTLIDLKEYRGAPPSVPKQEGQPVSA